MAKLQNYSVTLAKLFSMTDQNYYTPELEDLFVGYECEFNAPDLPHCYQSAEYKNGNGWMPVTIKRIAGIDVGCYRTLHLTRTQIEAEGWIVLPRTFTDSERRVTIYGLNLDNNTNEYEYALALYGDWIFIAVTQGETIFSKMWVMARVHKKSINEFRKICKMVGIQSTKKQTT